MKILSRIRLLVRSASLALALLLMMSGLVLAAGLAAQTNRDGGVEVKVTPRILSPTSAAWEFEVAFSTHSVTLTGDPAQFSLLVDSKGREHAALSWQGDPPGSHHRQGVLRFKPLAYETQVELRINGVGGAATRRFRWELR